METKQRLRAAKPGRLRWIAALAALSVLCLLDSPTARAQDTEPDRPASCVDLGESARSDVITAVTSTSNTFSLTFADPDPLSGQSLILTVCAADWDSDAAYENQQTSTRTSATNRAGSTVQYGPNFTSCCSPSTLTLAPGTDYWVHVGDQYTGQTTWQYVRTAADTDEEAPTFSSASVKGNKLTITFSEALGAAANLANSAFAVKKTPSGGMEADVSLHATTGPAISGSTVVLTLATAVVASDGNVTVSYTKPASDNNNRIEDAAGNEADTFGAQSVTNDSDRTITITAGASPITEGETASFTVTADVAPNSNLFVRMWQSESSFVDTFGSRSITITAGSTTATLSLETVNDSTVEDSADLTVQLQTGTGYTVGSPSSASVRVNDDDGDEGDTAPAFSSAAVVGDKLTITFDEALAAAANLSNSAFGVKKTPASTGTEADVDLHATTGPSISGSTVVLTLATAVVPTDGSIKVSYTQPTTDNNNRIEDAAGLETDSFSNQAVTNNTLPTVTITAGTSPVTEGTDATFTVTSNTVAPSAGLTVNLTVAESSNGDYVASGDEGDKTATISSGDTTATHSVTTQNDSVDETNGSVTVTVKTGTGYTVGSGSSATVNVNDNDPTAPCAASTVDFWDESNITVSSTHNTISVSATNNGLNSTIALCKTGSASIHRTASVATVNPSHTFTGLDADTQYWARVGNSATGTSAWVAIKTKVAPANNAATGAPTISGFPQVGQTLTAATGGISDSDGLTGVSWSYQWIRVDGATETDISGATSSTYTLAAADQGKTIKVEVAFQDDAGNNEELTSTATGTVVAAAPACTTGNVWCATLTVAVSTVNRSQATGYCATASGRCTTAYGSLSDTSITLGSTSYTVQSVRWGGGTSPGDNFHLTLGSAFPAADVARLNLKVDSHSLALSGATQTYRLGALENNYRWTSPPAAILGYEAGRQVTVELLQADPTITIAAGTSPVTEGTAATFTVTASPTPAADLMVNLTVADVEDSDFVADTDEGSKTVTISANTATATYSVATVGDTTDEDDGDVTVTVATGTGYTVGSPDSASVTVNDDDVADTAPSVSSASVDGDKLTITFDEPLAAAANLANSAFAVKKTPSGGTEADVNLHATTAPSISGSTVVLTLAAAVVPTDGSIKVSYTQPTTDNSNRIEDAAGLETDSFSDQAVTNNTVPTLTIAGGSAVTEGTAATFTITAHAAPAANVTVNLTVADDSESDFVAAADEGSQTVTLTANTTSVTYSVATVDDSTKEDSGDVTVTVATGAGYTVGTADSASVTVNDDDNAAPTVANEIPDQSAVAGTAFSFQFAANAFNDTDTGDTLTYTATKGDDNALPAWLTFTASSRTFAGTPPAADVGTLSVKVTASDGRDSVSDTFDIEVAADTAPDFGTETVTNQSYTQNTAISSLTLPAATGGNGALSYALTPALPTGLTFTASTRVLSGTPTATQSATTYTYTVTDGDLNTADGDADTLTFTITVAAADTAPSVSSATVVGDKLTITFSEALAAAANLSNDAFAVKKTPASTGTEADVGLSASTGPSISGSTVVLTLATAVVPTDTSIKVSYTKPTTDNSNRIEDTAGLETDSFSDQAVTNNTVPTVTITAGTSPVTEGTDATFTVTSNTAAPSAGLTVNLTVAESSNGDYVASGDEGDKTVTISSGATTATYSVTTENDSVDETNGSVTVTVKTGTGYTVGSDNSASVNVNDNDDPPNNAPVFTGQPTTATVDENSADDTAVMTTDATPVALTITATDADAGDSIAYTLDTEADKLFEIGDDGAITVKVESGSALDHEGSGGSITVTVTASDGTDSADHTVTITIADVDEAPSTPGRPTVTGASRTSVTVTWTAPATTGPAIDGYGVQYKLSTVTGWTDHSFTGTGTSTTISGLRPGTTYDVRVMAKSPEDDSAFSATGSGATIANNTPVFTSQPTTGTVPENSADDSAVQTGNPAADLTVTATDADAGDSITYSLDTEAAKLFAIDSDGAITVDVASGSALDHEAASSITVTVTATDDHGDTATHDVTITIADVQEAPATPATPTVTAASASSVTVTWTAPTNTGPAINDYDVRFKLSTATTWTDHSFTGAGTSTTIASLSPSTTYDVQVMAKNPEDDSGWSATGSGATNNPTITIAPGTSPVTEGTDATFTVTADAAPAANLTVNLSVADVPGSDFVASGNEGSKTVTLDANTTSVTYSVATVGDTTDETSGSVTVTVATGAGYTVGSPASANVRVNDDDVTVTPANALVSTIGQEASTGQGNLSAFDLAQGFRTGANSGGYTLQSIELDFRDIPSGVTVTLATGVSATNRGTTVATLSNPTLASGVLAFTAPADTTLSASTTYFVIVSATSGTPLRTSSNDEDAGAATGWRVQNNNFWRTSSAGSWQSGGHVYRIRVNGTAKTAAPTITIAAGTSPVTEGTAATFTVTANPAPSANLSVNLSVADDDDSDFVAAADEGTQTVTITASSTTATYSVATVDDSTVEDDGDVTVTVATGAGYTVGTDNSASVTVEDNDVTDTAPSVSSASVDGDKLTITFSEALAAASNLSNDAFAVKKTPHNGTETNVGLSTSTAPAISGSTVVLTLANAVVPRDSDIKVSYTKPASGTDNTIKDTADLETDSFTDQAVTNNTVPTLTITGGDAVTEGTDAEFTITAHAASASNITVNLSVADVSGSDFVAAADEGSQTVTLTANTTSVTYSVPTVGDTTEETSGNVTVTLATGTGYTVGSANSATVMVNDDDAANNAPVFTSQPTTATVDENSADGTAVMTTGDSPAALTVTATDADGDDITYTLDADAAKLFEINSSGAITVKVEDGSALDHEASDSITVRVTASDSTDTATHDVTITIADVNDDPTGSVTITGTVTEDQTLTATTTTVADQDGLGTLSYQWKRGGTDITGATSSTYTLVQADVGAKITVTVSWTDDGDTAESLTSEETDAVENVNDDPTGSVTITGTATEDQTLTADTTAVADEDGLGTFSYQWKRGGTNITGATSSTYVLVQADVGAKITVTVSWTDDGNTAQSLTSAETDAVANVNDDPTGSVTITGTVTEDQTLTANTTAVRDEDGLGTFSYQWKRGGTNITGATSSTYTLVQADVGARITVTVSWTDDGNAAQSLTSAETDAVANVNDDPTGSVTITGTVTQKQTLTANTTAVADEDGLGTFSYQWKRGGTDITGATSSTYVLVQADVGAKITVTVSWTDDGNTAQSLTSEETAAVANVNDAPAFSGQPTTATVDENSDDDTAVQTGTPAADLTITATDLDGDTITYTLDDESNKLFDIDSSSGAITVSVDSGSALNHEARDSITATVTATDTNSAATTHDVTISIADVNEAPVFTSQPATATVDENSDDDTAVQTGSPATDLAVTATDVDDGDTITYSLDTEAAKLFAIDTSGNITVQVADGSALDHEGHSGSITATVTATDSGNATVTHDVTISIADVNEPPAAPDAPTVAGASTSSLNVNWTAPANTGPPINDYDVQYKFSSDSTDNPWTDHSFTGAGTSTTINVPDASRSYDVQVMATNAEGSSDWSATGSGSTNDLTITIAAGTTPVTEGTAATFTVTSSPAVHRALEVQLRVSEAAGSDFVASGDEGFKDVTINQGETTATYSVTTQADSTDEPNGSVTVLVAGTNYYKLGTTTSATVVVNDDDDPPTNPPVFRDQPTTATVAENSADDTALQTGDPPVALTVTAEDEDGDTLTYSLDSTSDAVFDIDSDGAITVQVEEDSALDHEATSSYTVTVTATDGTGTASHEVEVSVTDELEPPDAPEAPTVTAASATSVTVSWTAPDTTGKPDIDDYNVRYRVSGATTWTAHSFTGAEVTTTIPGLSPSTTYEVQVQASNDEGDGDWSGTGSGETGAPTNNTPVFISPPSSLDIAENSAGDTIVGTVAATDADAGDTLTYSLDGTSGAVFDIDSSGVITVESGGALDYEDTPSYAAVVTVSDGTITVSQAVTINVTDEEEPPEAPDAPTVTGATATSVSVSWTAPDTDDRPDITGYNVRYKLSTETGWTGHDVTGTGTSTTISSLTAGLTYDVQVQATNEDGASGWSDTGSGETAANNAPVFTDPPTAVAVAENAAGGAPVVAITATDPDGDTLSYSLDSATDAVFDIDSSGLITVAAGATPDHEATPSFAAVVTASDGTADATHSLTISITDVLEPPDAPATPTVTGASTTSVTVSWTAPDTTGRPDITDYDLRYRASGATEWTDHSFTGTGTTTTITGLSVGTTYEAQVMAGNDEGDSGWSATGSGAPEAPTPSTPTITIAAGTSPVTEGTAASFTVTASPAPTTNLTVNLSVADVVGSNFVASGDEGDKTVSISANTASATYSVATVADATDEESGDLTVTVASGAGYTVGSPSSASVIVNDDDDPSSNAPVFTNQATTARVPENSADGTAVVTITATDADGDTISYSLDSTSDAVFDINSDGAITVQVDSGSALDHEDMSSYTVTVTANDGANSASHQLTISVTDEDEPPSAPAAPIVTGVSATSVTVSWTAPINTGKPDISDYDLRYRASGATEWTDHDFTGSGTSTTISNLSPGTTYQAQVMATNDDGMSGWSPTGSGRTGVAPPPASGRVSGSTVTLEFEEELDTQSVPDPDDFTVTLIDAVAQARYLAASPVRASQLQVHRVTAVSIEGSTLALTVSPPVPAGRQAAVSYTPGEKPLRTSAGRQVREFTQTVSDAPAEEPPAAPTDVTVSAASPSSLEVTWTAPQDTGTRLDGYAVQYRASGEARWTDHPHSGTATRSIIEDLSAGTAHEVRVRSLGAGESAWATAEGRTAVAPPAASGMLPDLTLVAGAAAVEVNADAAFTGRELAYVYTSSNAAVASFDGSGTVTANPGEAVRLQGESAGDVRITVAASNAGGSASVTFAVTVKAISDEEAEVLGLSLDGLTRTLLSGATGVIGARMAASETPAPSLQSLTPADARAALAGLLGLPAIAPVTAAPGNGLAAGYAASAGHWSSAGTGTATGHGFATGHGAAPGAGGSFGAGLQPGNGLSGFAPGELWNRSFAFSIAPAGEQTPGGGQSADHAPTGGGQALGLAQAQDGSTTSADSQSPAGDGGPGSVREDWAPGRAEALPRWTVWGAGDVQRFSGGEGAQRYDGDWRTAYIGADRRFGERWLAGVALASGEGEAGYSFGGASAGGGRLRTDLSAVYPYLKGVLGGGTEVWATLGAGTGEASNQRGLGQAIVHEGDLRMSLAAAGLRHVMIDDGAVRISVLADAGAASLDIDGEGSLADMESTAHRARVGVELSGAGAWSPFVSLNGRHDGGAGESGAGIAAETGFEAEAGLRRSGARVDFELRGRWMALSGDAEYEESGATATLRIKSAPDGTGLTALLTPAWGRPGATDFVWSQGPMPVMRPWAGTDMGMAMNAELGYGIESWWLRGLVTPTLGYGRGAPGEDRLRLGADYAANPEWLPVQLSIGFGLQRQMMLEGPVWGGELRVQKRW